MLVPGEPPMVPRVALAFVVLALLLGALAPAVAAPSPRDGAIAESLRTRRVQGVHFDDQPLDAVVTWLRVATGHNFHVKSAALAKANVDPAALRFTATLEDVTVETLLRILFEPHGLAVKVQGGVVFVTTKADAAGKPVTRLYGISHITYVKVDFIAPSMDLKPSGFTADEYEPERLVENDPLSTGDAVVELIKEIVPAEWDTEGWSIRGTDSYLVVRAPADVQARVQRALHVIAALK
jgi:hypothetical protein